jgi:hypothetical protein
MMRKMATAMKARARGTRTELNNRVTAKYVMQQPSKLEYQLDLKESQLNTRHDADSEINASKVPSAAPEAKLLPCSTARKKITGPDVNGRPRIKPPTEGPHRWAITLTAQMSAGTLTSLMKSKSHEP